MPRLRYAGLTGSIGSGGLTSSATSHTFGAPLTYANGTTVPTLTGSDFFFLTISSSGRQLSEIIKVTAYNSSTGVATIARGQEGTTGVAHSAGDSVTLSSYPSDYPGAYCRLVNSSTSNWLSNSGANVQVQQTAWTSDTITDSSMWSSGTPGQIVIPTDGLYMIHWAFFPQSSMTWYVSMQTRINGTNVYQRDYAAAGGSDWWTHNSQVVLMRSAGDVVTVWYESRGGPVTIVGGVATCFWTVVRI